jgi:hypothetical protein
MGAAIGNIGGAVGGVGGAKEALAGIARTTAADGARVSGMLGQIVESMTASLKQGEQAGKAGGVIGGALSGAVGGPVGSLAKQALQSFQSDLTRLAYIAALQKAMSKAGRPGPFNVETAINDLWTALDGVRKGNKATLMSAQMQQQAQVLETMSNMLKQMHDTAGSVIQNMR